MTRRRVRIREGGTSLLAFGMLILAPVHVQGQAARPDAGPHREQPPLYSDMVERGAAEAPAEAESGQVEGRFHALYLRSGSPRVAVFWGRALSDRPREVIRGRSQVREDVLRLRDRQGETEAELDARAVRRTYAEERRRDPPRRWLPEEVDSVIRAAFEWRLLKAGVHVVDRDLAIRLRARNPEGEGDPLDFQRLEVEALAEHADWVAEVLSIDRDSEEPRFRVSVRRVEDGQVLARFTNDRMPTSGDSLPVHVWRTRKGQGFEKIAVEGERPTPRERGVWLAEEILRQLSVTLAHRPGAAAGGAGSPAPEASRADE